MPFKETSECSKSPHSNVMPSVGLASLSEIISADNTLIVHIKILSVDPSGLGKN